LSCTIWLSVTISFLTWHRLTLRVINNFKGTYSICFGSLQQTERSITTLQNGMPMFCGNTNRLFPQAYGSLVIGFFLEGAHCTVFFGDQVRDGGSNPRRLSSSQPIRFWSCSACARARVSVVLNGKQSVTWRLAYYSGKTAV